MNLKLRETHFVFDESNFHKINLKLSRILLLKVHDDPDKVVKILCDYVDGCVPLTYAGADKNIGMDWFAFSMLSWLSMVSSDLDPKWLQIHRNWNDVLLKHQSDFANGFVKFPSGYFKPWAVEIGCRILSLDLLQVEAEFMIKSLLWIVRHGKVYRESLMKYLTQILASGSCEWITELTRNGCSIICSLSGKTSVVNHPEEGLSLRCNHQLEESPALKLNTVSEDVVIFLLEFVFDENDHSVVHRTELFRSILCHSAHTDSLRSSVLKQLRNVAEKSIASNNVILQRVVLKCFRIVVQAWKEVVVADFLHVVFQLVLSAYSSLMICWASSVVKEVAADLNITTELLFHRNVPVMCDIVLSSSDIEWRTNFVSLVPEVFQLLNVPQWLHVLLPKLVPKLILECCCKGSNAFFDDICTLLHKLQSDVIRKHFASIYTFLLLHSNADERSRAMEYIERITHSKLVGLRAPNFQSVHNDLLLQLHSHRDRVLDALSSFASEDGTVSKNRKTQHHIGDYLQLQGILVHLDSVLVSKTLSDDVKVEALSSLSDVLHLMGAEKIMAFRLKVLATLRTAMQLSHGPFPSLNAAAWEAFVRNVKIEELGPLISQITVSMLPLHQFCSEQIRSVLYYIVVDRAQELSQHLCDLHFLPELPGNFCSCYCSFFLISLLSNLI